MHSRLLLTLLSLIILASFASAGDIRHDRPDASYTTLGNLPQFNGVGNVDFFEPSGATLISRNWLLTAGHLANPTQVKFGFGTGNVTTYNIIQNIAHPLWSGNVLNGNDFRLLQISGDPIADGVASHVYPLYRGPILDQVITNVGYGATGNGITGYDPNSFGTRRGGNMVPRAYFVPGSTSFDNTTVERTNRTTIMLADFISPTTNLSTLLSIINGVNTTATPQDLEYMIAPRDSGSPALFFDAGEWKIAGVGSFIATQNQEGMGPLGIYGDVSGFSLLDDFTYNWIVSTASIPEPSTIALMTLIVITSLAVLYYYHRRRQTQWNHPI